VTVNQAEDEELVRLLRRMMSEEELRALLNEPPAPPQNAALLALANLPAKRGRPRRYENGAARAKAYRLRRKLREILRQQAMSKKSATPT
jgi:hypothetical protein